MLTLLAGVLKLVVDALEEWFPKLGSARPATKLLLVGGIALGGAVAWCYYHPPLTEQAVYDAFWALLGGGTIIHQIAKLAVKTANGNGGTP
jgi:hypothetical protein